MRIGFLGPFGSDYNADYGSERQIGAIEHQIFGLAKELSLRGREVFVTRNWKGKDKENIIQGVHFVNVNLFGSIGKGFYDSKFPFNDLSYLYYLVKAPKRLERLSLDVINTSGVLSGWLALKSICTRKSRSVFITHNNDIYVQGGSGYSRTPYLTKKMLHAINKRYDATIATTKGVEEYLRTLGLSCRATIHEAIDPTEYKRRDEEGFLLTAGRFVPHKKVEDLMQAYSEISDDIKEDLVIIGSGPYEKALKRYAAFLSLKERIRFIPFLPKSKYRDYLAKCSIFILPSVAEAFGVVIIEAMASGKPVIARNIIGPRDILTHGYNGFLFQTVSDLKKCMQILLSDKALRMKLGSNARNTVEEKFTFKKIATKYLKLYDQICQT
jgi:glycosyltransferase involved in cell wall biosynthesis